MTKDEARLILWLIDKAGYADGWGSKKRYATACALATKAQAALAPSEEGTK